MIFVKKQINEIHELQAAEQAMKWYGWGGPIGLSIFLLTLVAIVVILKIAFFG